MEIKKSDGSYPAELIFSVDAAGFLPLVLELFRFQYKHNPVYKAFTDALHIDPASVHAIRQIPFLPVGFFKTHEVKTTSFIPEIIFESSGTSQTVNSRHLVKDANLYKNSFTRGFEYFYGSPNDWCILGLLPAYLERSQSSLVFMVDELIKISGHPRSGFYLYNHETLVETLRQLEQQRQKALLIGVTFALLDMAEEYGLKLKHSIVMETGGMKGRRKEIVRPALHHFLESKWGLKSVHSEYGMTELLSQAYSGGDGIFNCPPWMKAFVRKEDDPLDVQESGEGIINIIDMANCYSCCFIATDDAGRVFENGSFEISGRTDGSDLRGCSLLVS